MIWYQGELYPDDKTIGSASDRGLLLGDGLFETINVVAGKPIWLKQHLCRLKVSARQLALPIETSTVSDGLFQLIKAVQPGLTGSARITILRGPAPRGLVPVAPEQQQPSALITIAPAASASTSPPTPFIVSPFVRSSKAPTSHMKTLSYTDNLMARRLASEAGAADAIFLNEHGQVCSTSMANLFVHMGDHFVTPPLSAGILPGIVRAELLKAAPTAGVDIRVRPVTLADLEGRWLFRSNSLMGVLGGWWRKDTQMSSPQGDMPMDLSHLYRAIEREEIEG